MIIIIIVIFTQMIFIFMAVRAEYFVLVCDTINPRPRKKKIVYSDEYVNTMYNASTTNTQIDCQCSNWYTDKQRCDCEVSTSSHTSDIRQNLNSDAPRIVKSTDIWCLIRL